MNWLNSILHPQVDASDLLQSSARKVIFTVGLVYLIWHITATLAWPAIFSPMLWLVSILMLVVVITTLRLLPRRYALAQVIWFTGLTTAVITAYGFFQRPDILLLLALLPMMAVVMIGLRGTLLLEVLLILMISNLWRLPILVILPNGYELTLTLVCLATGALGWGLSDNLMSATDAALYHYQEAVNRLEEARQHRAEISVLLKEQNKANYQLDRLNKMLEYARARAEEAREERDRFALSVSHELRSPLNFIIGFSDLMINSPEIYAPLDRWPAGLYEDVEQVYHSSTHLLSLINDILDMGRMDARQMTLFKERVEIAEIIEEVRAMTSAACQHKGLEFKTDLAADLPPLYVDRTRIRQVLINLVTNAMRYTPQGSITIHAHLRDEDTLEVQVEDTGEGIAPEDMNKLFEEFRQVGSDTNWRRHEGTGLGLSIGRRFIQLHGGEMTVSSQPGRGSIFSFTLPLRTSIDDLETANPAMLEHLLEQRRQKQDAENNTLLLLLSQQHYWAHVFAETLKGSQVTLLEDPEQLAAVTSQLYPRALLLDQALAGHPAVQQFMQAAPYDLPVIKISIPVDINKTSMLPSGVTHYLVKPVSRQVLLDAVHELGPEIHRILVIDDDPGMMRYLSQSLRSTDADPSRTPDYEIITALTGAEAWTCLEQTSVDAILLDLELPDINGWNLLDIIRTELSSPPPVIIITANDLSQNLSAQESGVLEVQMARPFNRKELSEAVSALVKNIPPAYQPDRREP